MCQTTGITFYLSLVCGYTPTKDEDTPYQMALAPAISFSASLVFSVFIQDKLQLYHLHSKYNLYLYTIMFFAISGVILFFMPYKVDFVTPALLYFSLILQGCGLANMLNTSTSLVSEMIG